MDLKLEITRNIWTVLKILSSHSVGNIHLDFTDLVKEAQLDLPNFELLTADQIIGDTSDFSNVTHEGLFNGLDFALEIDRTGEQDVLILDII